MERSSLACLADRSISYAVPSTPKRTVSAASNWSMSSISITATLCAIAFPSALPSGKPCTKEQRQGSEVATAPAHRDQSLEQHHVTSLILHTIFKDQDMRWERDPRWTVTAHQDPARL